MPKIVFKVNLDTVNKFKDRQPYNLATEDYHTRTRVTWFPDILRNNRELKDDKEFTVEGANALYLKNNYTTGEFKFLDVVSETP